MEALINALQQSKVDSGARLDFLTGQIAEESSRRAEAEARALAYHQAQTQAQVQAQVQQLLAETLAVGKFGREIAVLHLLRTAS